MFCLYFSRPSSLLPPLGGNPSNHVAISMNCVFLFLFWSLKFPVVEHVFLFFYTTNPYFQFTRFFYATAGWLLAAIHSILLGNDCRPLFYDFNDFSILWRSLWSPITPSCDSFNLEVVYDQMTNVCHRLAFEQILKFFCCSKFRITVWSSDENVTYGGYWAAKSTDASSLIEKM